MVRMFKARKRTTGLTAVGLGLVLITSLIPTSATAVEPKSTQDVGFGYWESSTFSQVYESITESNTPDAAAEILSNAIDDTDLVPGLDGLGEAEREDALRAAASAAMKDEALPRDVVALTSWGLGSPILGQPIANGYSWQFKDRYNWKNCDRGPEDCRVEDWMDFTYTVDPGGSGTRVTVSTLTWGNRLTGHRVDGLVYRDASQIKLKDGPQRQGDGTYTIMLSPHLTLTGYTFAAAFQTQVWGPQANSPAYHFRTGPTSTCTEPIPGAWRCIFLD